MNQNTNTFGLRDERHGRGSKPAVPHDYKNGHIAVGRTGFNYSSCIPLQQTNPSPHQHAQMYGPHLPYQISIPHPTIQPFYHQLHPSHNIHNPSINYGISPNIALPTQRANDAIIAPAHDLISEVAHRTGGVQNKAALAAGLRKWRKEKRLMKDEHFLTHMQKQGENKKKKRRVVSLIKKYVLPTRLAEERRELSYYGTVVKKQACNESIYGVSRNTYFEMIRNLDACTIEDEYGEFGKELSVLPGAKNDTRPIDVEGDVSGKVSNEQNGKESFPSEVKSAAIAENGKTMIANNIEPIEIIEEDDSLQITTSPASHSYSSGMDSFEQDLEGALITLISSPRNVVDEYKDGIPEDVVARTPYGFIQRKSMLTLMDGIWLDDAPINFYLGSCLRMRDAEMCIADATRKRSHFYSTHFMSKLVYRRKFDYEKVKRWGKNAPGGDIFNLKYLVIPINVSNIHWCCAVVFMEGKKIQLFDSCGSQSMKWLKHIKEYLSLEWSHKHKSEFDGSAWELVKSAPDVPRQLNGEKPCV